jgi:UDP-glucuronate 4-epimerase
VYGDQAAIPYTESEQNLHPNSFYGATKLANELLTPTLIKNSSTIARGLRFFTVYGPWGRPDMAYFRMIANVVSGSEFNFFGDGEVQRDFTYIEDVVDSITHLAIELQDRQRDFSDIVNVGGGKPNSMNYLVQMINKISGSNVTFKRKTEHKNDLKKTMANTQYIQSLIKAKPNTDLETGIFNTFKWASNSEINPLIGSWVDSLSN